MKSLGPFLGAIQMLKEATNGPLEISIPEADFNDLVDMTVIHPVQENNARTLKEKGEVKFAGAIVRKIKEPFT